MLLQELSLFIFVSQNWFYLIFLSELIFKKFITNLATPRIYDLFSWQVGTKSTHQQIKTIKAIFWRGSGDFVTAFLNNNGLSNFHDLRVSSLCPLSKRVWNIKRANQLSGQSSVINTGTFLSLVYFGLMLILFA